MPGDIASFVGRQSELAELRRGLQRCEAGARSACVIVGEPGIGKTSLAQRFCTEARQRGVRVAWGRSWEAGGAPPFWPWTEALRSLREVVTPKAFLAAAGTRIQELAAVLPELLDEAASGLGTNTAESRFRLFDAVTTTIDNLARITPVVIVLDDLHSADPATALLARFVTRRADAAPVMLVATYREVDAARRAELSPIVADLVREAGSIRLRGLDLAEVTMLLEPVLDGRLHPSAVEALFEATDGNPLFVQGVAGGLRGRGDITRLDIKDLDIPADIHEVVRRRLDLLSEDARATLATASVVGREFDEWLVAAVSGASPSHVAAALDEAVALDVVVRETDPSKRRSFVHALYSEVLYRQMPRDRAGTLHAAVAAALERREGDHLSSIAYHLVSAGDAADRSAAYRFSRAAGDRAMNRYSFEEASRHFEHALALLPHLPDGSDELELKIELGRARMRAGDMDAGLQTFREAADAAKEQGRARELATIALEQTPERTGYPEEPRFLSLLEDALAMLGTADDALRARLLARHVIHTSYLPNKSQAAAFAQEALLLAYRSGDARAVGESLMANLDVTPFGPDVLEAREAILREAFELARTTHDLELEMRARLWDMQQALMRADRAGWERRRRDYALIAQRTGVPSWQWYARMLECTEAALDGRVVDAERLEQESLMLGIAARRTEATVLYGTLFSARAMWTSDPALTLAYRDAYRSIRAEAPNWTVFRLALAAVDALEGHRDSAAAELASLCAEGFSSVASDARFLSTLMSLAAIAVFIEDTESGALIYERLREFDDIVEVTGRGVAFMGPAALQAGALAGMLGDHDSAQRHFAKVLRLADKLDCAPMSAHARYWHAWTLSRRGSGDDVARARTLLESAIADYERLGFGPAESRAKTLLAEISAVGATSDVPRLLERGEFWSAEFGGKSATVKNTKGVAYIARLLTDPKRELHVLEMIDGAGRVRDMPGQSLLDSRAKKEIGARIRSLQEDIDEAESLGDDERAARSREEMDTLHRELAAALGLGGRDRAFVTAAEKARLNVTRAIRSAIERIERLHPPLGRHLASSIRTGTFCCYEPQEAPKR